PGATRPARERPGSDAPRRLDMPGGALPVCPEPLREPSGRRGKPFHPATGSNAARTRAGMANQNLGGMAMAAWLDRLEGVPWQALAMTWGVRIVAALLILLVGLSVVRWISRIAERGLAQADVEPTVVQ